MEGGMKRNNSVFAAACALVIWADNAYAYIDPGAGSMVLQAILAALIGIGVFVRQARVSIAAFFKRVKSKFSGKPADE
jgi:hypothetical protein